MSATLPYPVEVEASMRAMYLSLRENDRRRYAAVEAAKLGHGGIEYISKLLGCDPKTIRRGAGELGGLAGRLPEVTPEQRVRQKGAAGSRSSRPNRN